MPTDTLDTAIKIMTPAVAGIVVSATTIEQTLRIASLLVSITLSTYVFVREEKRRRNENKDEGRT